MLKLNSRQNRLLEEIYSEPIKSNILWEDIENLFYALGAEISEGKGSRVRIKLEETIAVFHRPHPRKEIDKGALKSVRKFLSNSGVHDEE
jgi:hypothetical protein